MSLRVCRGLVTRWPRTAVYGRVPVASVPARSLVRPWASIHTTAKIDKPDGQSDSQAKPVSKLESVLSQMASSASAGPSTPKSDQSNESSLSDLSQVESPSEGNEIRGDSPSDVQNASSGSPDESTSPISALTPELFDQPEDSTSTSVKVVDKSSDDPFQVQNYHYFDTQKIYSSLKYSGFTSGQADIVMLIMRDMLSRTLAECQENSIPSWAAENEAYLFDAACSELRNDIQMSRQSQSEQMRVDLMRLQRDLEILEHEINEVLNTLKVEMDMEINERKNITRGDENMIQLKIQEVNNKIVIEINSDVKSEIEILRWQTTRRGLMAVIFVAAVILMAISLTRKEPKPPPRRRETGVPQEIHVPILTTSEVDDGVEDRAVESLR